MTSQFYRPPARQRAAPGAAGLVVAASLAACAGLPPTTNPAPGPSAAAPASAATTALRIEPYRFVSAAGDEVAAELGHITVPERRGDPHTRNIDLAFVRFPAVPGASGPPIVYLAGGPGGSGIDTARGPRFAMFMALRALGDVIAVDQRGTGLSNAIPWCDAPSPWPSDQPTTRRDYTAWMRRVAAHCAGWWRNQRVDITGYTTEQSADDIDSLRQALGADSLRLVGISYGTHLAMSVMRRHGEHVARVVLASAEGPDDTIKRPSRTEAFLRRVLTTEQHTALRDTLARLDAEPARARYTDPQSGRTMSLAISKLDVQLVVGYLIKNPSTLQLLAEWLPAMQHGDFSAITPILAQAAAQPQGMRGMPEAMDAASGASRARLDQIAAEAPATLLEDTLNFPGLALAQPLGIADLGDAFRAPLRSTIPTLMLSGTFDGRTYIESHRDIAAGLSRATHVIVDGAGHDLFMASPEVTARMVAFLAGAAVSADAIVASSVAR